MALSGGAFSDFGSAVSDIFAAEGDRLKAQGDQFEQERYQDAAALAEQNAQFTAQSTAIQQAAADRQLYGALGRTTSEVAGAGFSMSGSALDLLREGAQQGATAKAVLGQQGLITEAGYQEQAQSYNLLANAAGVAIKEDKLAATGSDIAAGISALAGVASLATGGATGAVSAAVLPNVPGIPGSSMFTPG
jgi:hypothetical protein